MSKDNNDEYIDYYFEIIKLKLIICRKIWHNREEKESNLLGINRILFQTKILINLKN